MTQPGETDDYTASMHVKALIEHGGAGIVDYVLVNNKEISAEMQEYYAQKVNILCLLTKSCRRFRCWFI